MAVPLLLRVAAAQISTTVFAHSCIAVVFVLFSDVCHFLTRLQCGSLPCQPGCDCRDQDRVCGGTVVTDSFDLRDIRDSLCSELDTNP